MTNDELTAKLEDLLREWSGRADPDAGQHVRTLRRAIATMQGIWADQEQRALEAANPGLDDLQ